MKAAFESGLASTCAVRASTAIDLKPSSVGLSPRVRFQIAGSSASCDMYIIILPG
jgi:hypothetical protein